MADMTFAELHQKLPNGFHDAAIRAINLDFAGHSIVISIDLLVGLPDSPKREGYRTGTLTVTSPYLFFVEPPHPGCPFLLDGSQINASGGPVKMGESSKLDPLLRQLPAEATALALFLDDWNSYLCVAGADVKFSWDNGEAIV